MTRYVRNHLSRPVPCPLGCPDLSRPRAFPLVRPVPDLSRPCPADHLSPVPPQGWDSGTGPVPATP
jgi:hypothetical protein